MPFLNAKFTRAPIVGAVLEAGGHLRVWECLLSKNRLTPNHLLETAGLVAVDYIASVSLTSQIGSADSPFMRFAQRTIPHSGAVTAVHDGVYRTAIKTKSSHSGKNPDWGLIGTAVDFRLRLAFTGDRADPIPRSARNGHALLTKNYPEAAPLLADLTAATAAVLDEASPYMAERIELPESLENDLIRHCVVAGQLDQLYHAYPFVIDKTTLLDGEAAVTFDQACAQVPWFVIDQIHDQVRRANVGLGSLRDNAIRVSTGMSFAGSDLIGGADADLLVDGLLLDFKSTHAATTVNKSDVYQLAGYTLLDFDDAHRIERVGIYLARHGVMRTFAVSSFFELLGATATVAELRAELREELIANDDRRRRMRLDWLEERNRAAVTVVEEAQSLEDTRLVRSVRWLRSMLRN